VAGGSSAPWRCQVQFRNGFQLDITHQNGADFAVPGHAAALSRAAPIELGPAQGPGAPQREPGNALEAEPGNIWLTPEPERPPQQSEGMVPDHRYSAEDELQEKT
jgi:hypothetical protein